MLVRPTVRVLLLDRDDRLLLIKTGNLGSADVPPVFWATAGGGIEAGETIEAAAIRETLEETGISGIELGPVVWLGEVMLRFPGEETTLFQHSYIVARCDAGAFDSRGWTQQERDTILELRWWTLDAIRSTDEHLYPPGLAELLPDVLAGNYPTKPLVIKRF